ncbi:bacterial Ig-like domain-containing protein [Bifidobacterium oedipodis]|nr:bacterial Ig-like domain-containing protein [Bifidobacterium sp. DSM 109957]
MKQKDWGTFTVGYAQGGMESLTIGNQSSVKASSVKAEIAGPDADAFLFETNLRGGSTLSATSSGGINRIAPKAGMPARETPYIAQVKITARQNNQPIEETITVGWFTVAEEVKDPATWTITIDGGTLSGTPSGEATGGDIIALPTADQFTKDGVTLVGFTRAEDNREFKPGETVYLLAGANTFTPIWDVDPDNVTITLPQDRQFTTYIDGVAVDRGVDTVTIPNDTQVVFRFEADEDVILEKVQFTPVKGDVSYYSSSSMKSGVKWTCSSDMTITMHYDTVIKGLPEDGAVIELGTVSSAYTSTWRRDLFTVSNVSSIDAMLGVDIPSFAESNGLLLFGDDNNADWQIISAHATNVKALGIRFMTPTEPVKPGKITYRAGVDVTGLPNGPNGTPNISQRMRYYTFTLTVLEAWPTPAPQMDSAGAYLTGLEAGVEYLIAVADGEAVAYTADDQGRIAIAKDWYGKTITIVRKGDDTTRGDSASVTLEIANNVVSIAVTQSPTVTEYQAGDTFDPAGLEVTKTMANGDEIVLEADEYTLSSPDMSKAGEQTVTVTLNEDTSKTATFTITITAIPTPPPSVVYRGITIVSKPDRTTYGIGDELDLSGLKVAKHWSDGSTQLVKADDYEVSGFDSSKPGAVTITVTLKADRSRKVTFEVKIVAGSVSVHRLYNTSSGEHFYTANVTEKNGLVSRGWRYEGVAFVMSDYGTEVHRFYNPYSGLHMFTTDAAETAALRAAGWRYEGVAFHAPQDGGTKVARFYNTGNGDHLFTANAVERAAVLAAGWRDEGVGFVAE